MDEKAEEVVFQTAEEAFQKLADLTGKKVMVPDKAEPTVAEDENEEEATNAQTGNITEIKEELKTKSEKYKEIADQLGEIEGETNDLGL